MAVTTASGSRVYIGTTTPADDETEFLADSYVEIEEVESIGEFGDESAQVTFAALKNRRMRKFKGTRDAGTMALVVGHDALDPGQQALDAAEATEYEYNFKVEANDARSALYTNTTYYFRALVMSKRENHGGNDNVVRTTYNLAINSDIIKIASELA